ncbi:MAG: SAM-dependent methyltransferase [Myxococcota bacterium]|jgi:SAM-dependent methyltransferase
MDWTDRFYARQAEWAGLYQGEPEAHHHDRVERLIGLAGPPPQSVLELGAGGGQHAALTADAGYTITAVEIQPRAAENARTLAVNRPGLSVVEGDFYTLSLPSRYDIVCCWDGFGIGPDADQRRLLERMRGWLAPGGLVLVDVYTPWYAAASAGRGWAVGDAHRTYGFDAGGCRWLDTWQRGDETVTQSLRCYSPADLRLLLEGTGFSLEHFVPGGGMDWAAGRWVTQQPLQAAMSFTAVLVSSRG